MRANGARSVLPVAPGCRLVRPVLFPSPQQSRLVYLLRIWLPLKFRFFQRRMPDREEYTVKEQDLKGTLNWQRAAGSWDKSREFLQNQRFSALELILTLSFKFTKRIHLTHQLEFRTSPHYTLQTESLYSQGNTFTGQNHLTLRNETTLKEREQLNTMHPMKQDNLGQMDQDF